MRYFVDADKMEKKCWGVLPYRIVDGEKGFLLVFEQFSQCWSLPKGHMEAGETEEETALRELFEETGLHGTLESGESAMIEYPISTVARKQVVFFLGQVNGTPKVREGESDGFQWVRQHELKDYLFADTVEACRNLLGLPVPK